MAAEVTLYVAASLDGYLAREDGGLDWLENLPNPDGSDYGYAAFYAGIDTVVMGRKTYETVTGFDVAWPYGDRRTCVVTRRAGYSVRTENTEVLGRLDEQALRQLKESSRRGIWLVGGGELITAFLESKAIDKVMLCIIPVVLGDGIPLWPGQPPETWFRLVAAQAYASGAVMLTYQR